MLTKILCCRFSIVKLSERACGKYWPFGTWLWDAEAETMQSNEQGEVLAYILYSTSSQVEWRRSEASLDSTGKALSDLGLLLDIFISVENYVASIRWSQ